MIQFIKGFSQNVSGATTIECGVVVAISLGTIVTLSSISAGLPDLYNLVLGAL